MSNLQFIFWKDLPLRRFMLQLGKHNPGLIVVAFLIGVFIVSCDNATVHNQSRELPNAVWHQTDTLTVIVPIADTQHYHTIFLDTRISAEYPYSNLYLKTVLVGPSGQNITDVQNFEITDKAGKWLGSGFGDLHSYGLPIFKALELKQLGNYTVKVIPYMRKDSLSGVHDIGIRATKGKEIF